VINTENNADKSPVNLKFLVEAGLNYEPDRKKNIEKFLINQAAGEGPALPSQVQVLPEMLQQLRKAIESIPQNTPAQTKEQQEKMMMMMQMMQNQEKTQQAPPPPKTTR